MKSHQEKINARRKYFLTQIKKANFPRGINDKVKDEVISYYGICLKHYPDAIPLIETLLFSDELKINWTLMSQKHKWSDDQILSFFRATVDTINNWNLLDKRTEPEKRSKVREILKASEKLNSLINNLDDPQIFFGRHHSLDPLNIRALKIGIPTTKQNETYKKLYMNLSGGLIFIINRSKEVLRQPNVDFAVHNYLPVIPSRKIKHSNQINNQFRNFLIRELYLNCRSIFDTKPRKIASTIILIANVFSESSAKESYVRSIVTKVKKPIPSKNVKKPKKVKK